MFINFFYKMLKFTFQPSLYIAESSLKDIYK